MGESGVGKSFLCLKVYHRLISRAVTRGCDLKYVNATMLENFDKLGKNPNAKKTILFLDGLDEYHQFLKPHDLQAKKELYYNLHRALSEYGRVVISARSNYYTVNKELGYSCVCCDGKQSVKRAMKSWQFQNCWIKYRQKDRLPQLIQ